MPTAQHLAAHTFGLRNERCWSAAAFLPVPHRIDPLEPASVEMPPCALTISGFTVEGIDIYNGCRTARSRV